MQERRLLSFSPTAPKKGPKPAVSAEEKEKQNLKNVQDQLNGLKNTFEDPDADAALEALLGFATSDAGQFNAQMSTLLESAANAEFKALRGLGSSADEALAKINGAFQALSVPVSFKLEGDKLIIESTNQPPEPTTQFDKMMNDFDSAMEDIQSGDSKRAVKGAIKMLMLLMDGMKKLQNGTIFEPFESDKAKSSKEKTEKAENKKKIRANLRLELNTTTYANLLLDKQAAAPAVAVDVAAKTTELNAEKGKKPAIDADIVKLTKEAAGPPVVPAKQAELATKQAELAALNVKIAALEREIAGAKKGAAAQAELTELQAMKIEFEAVMTALPKWIKDMATALKALGPDAAALALPIEGIATADDGHLRVTLTKGGASITADLRMALTKLGVAGSADIGMNAAGVITDFEKFASVLNPLNYAAIKGKIEKMIAADIKTKIEAMDDKDKISAALDKPGAWLKYEDDSEIIFANGEVWRQDKENPTTVNRLDTSTTPATWEEQSDKYFNGTSVEDTESDEGKRERGHVYENHEWREKTPLEITKNALKDRTNSFGVAAKAAMESPGSWQKEGANFDVFVVGGILYYQHESGKPTKEFDHQAYVDDETKNNNWKADTGKYINSSGTLVVRPGTDLYEYDRENKEWGPKSAADIKITLKVVGLPAGAEDLIANVMKADGWKELSLAGTDYEAICIKNAADGDKVYIQSKNNPGSCFILDLYLNAPPKMVSDKYFNGTALVDIVEKDAGKRERGWKYENREYTEMSKIEKLLALFKGLTSDEQIKAAIKTIESGAWEKATLDWDVRWIGGELVMQSATGKTTMTYDIDAYIADPAKNWEWKPDTGKYMNAAGEMKERPNNAIYTYERDKKDYKLKPVANIEAALVASGIQKDRAAYAAKLRDNEPGVWRSDTVMDSKMEAVREAGTDRVYIQHTERPGSCWVVDLRTMTEEKKDGQIYNGTALKPIPDGYMRGEYNATTREYMPITAKEGENRNVRRKADGVRKLQGLLAANFKDNGGGIYQIDLGLWAGMVDDDLQVRFNDAAGEWEWSIEDSNIWVSTRTAAERSPVWSVKEKAEVNKVIAVMKQANAVMDVS